MKANRNGHEHATEQRSDLDIARDLVLSALDDPALTPEGQAREIINRACGLGFPNNTARAAFSGELKLFPAMARELRRNFDARTLVEEAARLAVRANELARVAPAPVTLDAIVAEIQLKLASNDWNSLEAEFAAAELSQSRERLASCDARALTCESGRTIERRWLREINAPREEPYRSKFLNSLPIIPVENMP